MHKCREKLKGAFPLIRRDLRNRWHYYRYHVRYSFSAQPLVYFLTAVSFLLGAVVFVNEVLTGWSHPILGGIAIVQWVVAVLLFICQWEEKKEQKDLYSEQIPRIYDEVTAPHGDGWRRCVIRVMRPDRTVAEETTVFINDDIDVWLQDGILHTKLVRDRNYETKLKRKIRSNYLSIYRHFLRYNYRESLFYGRQFQNEKKFGISHDFMPGAAEIPVHRSCYFDTYLTNIIPGRQLRSTRHEEKFVSVDDDQFLPYRVTGDGRKLLDKLGEPVTSNELGVTTLGLLYHHDHAQDHSNDHIPLWTQNHQAQSSRGQYVATGSGSADWADCTYAMRYRGGSFQEAVIRGMEREMYEESIGNRDLTMKDFLEGTQTRITGYFRWLSKGGKSEFVGISRTELENLLDIVTPEESEVTGGIRIPSSTIFELKKQLRERVYPEDEEDEVIISEGCSISCAAAIMALQSLCQRTICSSCRVGDAGDCSEKSCPSIPCQALFPPAVQEEGSAGTSQEQE